MKSLFYSLIFCICSTSLLAQNASIQGSVLDESNNEPLEYANVLLFQPSDSSLVNGIVTNTDGSFLMTDIPAGTYYLQIQFIGYESRKM
ncbi:MAG: carboxypeptidase-like regulatory domain-containing protein, partial [Cyclobacteriaceae bacterium]